MQVKHEIKIEDNVVKISLELSNFHPTDKAAFIYRMDKHPDDIGASLTIEAAGKLDQFLAVYELLTLYIESVTENPRDKLEVIRSLRANYLGMAIAAVMEERARNQNHESGNDE